MISFVVPLYLLVSSSDGNDAFSKKSMKKVIYKNIIYGSIMTIASTINVVADTVIFALMHNPLYTYLGIIVFAFIAFDVITLVICPRMVISIWLPKYLKGSTKKVIYDEITSQNDLKSAPMVSMVEFS